jgi:hypothetical protein
VTQFVIIDTDIIIDAARGINQAVHYLQNLKRSTELAISVITKMELIVGCRQKTDLFALERFLRHFRVLMVNELISGRALELLQQYRLSHGLLIADALIATTALSLSCPLASKNYRDYRFIAKLLLWPYPKQAAL